MFRQFSFLNTGTDSAGDRNWRTLNDSSKSSLFLPTLTSATGTVTPGTCIAQLYGPMVFVLYTLSVPVAAGFTTTTTINLPFQALNNGGTLTAPTVLQVFLKTGAVVDTCYFNNSTTLKFAGGYINASAATQIVNIQGWYFRN